MSTKRQRSITLPQGPTLGPVLDTAILRLFEEQAEDPQMMLAQSMLTRTNVAYDLQSRAGITADINVFNNEVTMEGAPVTDQGVSGRCWIFSTLNVIRVFYARRYNLAEFQLSQSYLFFYDHLSKANKFFEDVLRLADRPIGDRTLQCCFANCQLQDGGDFDLAVSLIEEFGLVPQAVFPESFNSTNSAHMDEFLNAKLREYALDIRAAYATVLDGLPEGLCPEAAHKRGVCEARKLKTEMLKRVWRVLATCCGTPPRPDSHFKWEFRDKDGNFRTVLGTPLEFVRAIPYSLSDHIVLLNDPRNAYGKVYTIDLESIVVQGRPLKMVNVAIDLMKDIAIAQLQTNVPCWISCDVEKALAKGAKTSGIMDIDYINYHSVFGTTARMSKAERLNTTDSAPNQWAPTPFLCGAHELTFPLPYSALVLTGVHLDDAGRPVRWRVENSWGPDVGFKGFFVMTDAFFTEYVYKIAVPRRLVPEGLVDVYDNAPLIQLTQWDALA